MKLNIALNLPDDVRAADIMLSQELAEQHDAYFVLGDKGNYPHITVYAVEFPDNMVQQVLAKAQELAAASQPIACVVKRVEAHQGYIGIEVGKSPEIVRFHEAVVKVLAPLRERNHDKGARYGMSFTPKQQANIEKYGYADAMQLYNPHFTITRLKEEKAAEEIARNLVWNIPAFTVASLGVYVSGDHGTCKELLQEFSLL